MISYELLMQKSNLGPGSRMGHLGKFGHKMDLCSITIKIRGGT